MQNRPIEIFYDDTTHGQGIQAMPLCFSREITIGVVKDIATFTDQTIITLTKDDKLLSIESLEADFYLKDFKDSKGNIIDSISNSHYEAQDTLFNINNKNLSSFTLAIDPSNATKTLKVKILAYNKNIDD